MISGELGLHLDVDGSRIDATYSQGNVYVFPVPNQRRTIRIMSRPAAQAQLGLRQIAVRQGSRFRVINAAHPVWGDHFAFDATRSLRRTRAGATLPAELFDVFAGPVELVIHLDGTSPVTCPSAPPPMEESPDRTKPASKAGCMVPGTG